MSGNDEFSCVGALDRPCCALSDPKTGVWV